MAIVKMKKIAMVGIDTDKDNIISGLMDFGAVEILDQTQTLQDPVWAGETVADESGDNLPMLEAKSGKAMQALDTIEKFGNLKSGISLFKSRRGISKERLNEIIASEDSGEKAVDFMLELDIARS